MQLLAFGPLRVVVRAIVIPFLASVSPIDSMTVSLRDASYELLMQALDEVGSVEHLTLDGQVVDVPSACVLMHSDTGEMSQEARAKAREAWPQWSEEKKINHLRIWVSPPTWDAFSLQRRALKRRKVAVYYDVEVPSDTATAFVAALERNETIVEGCDELLTNGAIAGNPQLERVIQLAKNIVRTDMSPESTLHRVLANFGKDTVPEGTIPLIDTIPPACCRSLVC